MKANIKKEERNVKKKPIYKKTSIKHLTAPLPPPPSGVC